MHLRLFLPCPEESIIVPLSSSRCNRISSPWSSVNGAVTQSVPAALQVPDAQSVSVFQTLQPSSRALQVLSTPLLHLVVPEVQEFVFVEQRAQLPELQYDPDEQVPQLSVWPQPSDVGPQFFPCAAQVVSTHICSAVAEIVYLPETGADIILNVQGPLRGQAYVFTEFGAFMIICFNLQPVAEVLAENE